MQSLTFLQACKEFNLKPEFITFKTCHKLAIQDMLEKGEFTPSHIIKYNKYITELLRLVEPRLKNQTLVSALASIPEEYMTELRQNNEEIPAPLLKTILTSMFLFATVFEVFDEADVSEPIRSLCWLKGPIPVLGGSPLSLILSGDEQSQESVFRALMRIEYGNFAAM